MFSPLRKSWLNKLSRSLFGNSRAVQPIERRRARPKVEVLEDRVVPNAYTVNTLNGGASSGSGTSGNLQYCVTQANANPNSTISFSANGTITLSAVVSVTANTTITGNGAASTLISGNNAHQVLSIASGKTVAISGLTIEFGKSTSGGGINNLGTLSLTNDTLSGNSATQYGGAIYDGNSGSNGSSLTLNNSTLSGNSAQYGGGALDNSSGKNSSGTATVTNSTFFNNKTTGAGTEDGGAILLSNSGTTPGTLYLTDDTLYQNTAAGGYGGGIYGTVASMDNTIVAGNSAGKNTGQDIDGTVTTANYNLVSTISGTIGITDGSNGNIVNASPGLASSLAYNNGAPTQTLALLSGSPAANVGDPGQATAITSLLSQNGAIRPTPPDIGAYQTPPPTVTPSTANLPNNSPGMYIYGAAFSTIAANDSVTFDNGVTGTVASATSTSLLVNLTIPGSLTLPTVLHATVAVSGTPSITEPVATVTSPITLPTVTMSTASIPDSSTTLAISGSNFDPTAANNAVTFNLGVTGTVTAVDPTGSLLTVTITAPPTALGALNAIVTTDGALNSTTPTQVATEVPGTWTVTDAGSGTGSFSDITLSYAAATALSGDTINFTPGLSGSTIAPASTLALNNNVTITGLGATHLFVTGSSTRQVFSVASGVTASVSGLTIENGLGANYNDGTLLGTQAVGGAFLNLGTLTLNNDVLSGNSAAAGGAIDNEGSLTLSNVTLSSNSATSYYGGAILNDTGTTLTVNDSTFNGNSSNQSGGALYDYYSNSGTPTTSAVSNSTFFGNKTTGSGKNGGAIYNNASLTLTSDTISGNSAAGGNGGGIYISGTATSLDNTIVAGNTANSGTDISANSVTANYSLIGNASGITTLNGSNNITNTSAGLASALANNGGRTLTLALLTGSPAFTTGDPTQNGTTSQNAQPRYSTPDIGAYQTPQPTVTPNNANLPSNSPGMYIYGTVFSTNPALDSVTFDNGVTGTVTAATTTSLLVSLNNLGVVSPGTVLDASVTANGLSSGPLTPVATVSAPITLPTITSSAASLPDSSTTLTINGSNFDTTAANNAVNFNLGLVGTVTAVDPTGTQLTVTITTPPTALGNLTAVVTTDGAVNSATPTQVATEVNGTWTVTDPGAGAGSFTDITLPYAATTYLGGDTINFDPGLSTDTITVASTLALNSSVTITGLGAANLAVSGGGTQQIFRVASGATVSVSGLTLENGLGALYSDALLGSQTVGGAFLNLGTLTLNNDVLSGNSAAAGGAIANEGSLTLTNVTLSGNSATVYGGAVFNDSGTSLTVNDSTFNGNSSVQGGGGAIYDYFSTATVTNSTLFGNSTTGPGAFGGGYSGGAISTNSGSLSLKSDTISGNTATGYGGGVSGTVTSIDNTIIAGNSAGKNTGLDMYGTATSATYSLFGNSSGVTFTNGSATDQLDVNADLGSLQYNGGSTQTMLPNPGSPALGNGDGAAGPYLDQRGVIRPGLPYSPDIGAVEVTVVVPTVVWVNDNWDDVTTPGGPLALGDVVAAPAGETAPNSSGSTLIFGFNCFTTIQNGLSAVASGGTVYVLAGTFTENNTISQPVTMSGAGAGLTIVNGNAAGSVFIVNTGTTASISDLTIENGSIVGSGGGVNNSGTLTLSSDTITGNSATFLSPTQTGGGAGVQNFGSLTLTNDTISGNTADASNGRGGGVENGNALGSTATMTMSGTTISNNSALKGGGVYNYGTATLNNNTITGNTASMTAGNGGGIRNAGTLSSTGDLISGNFALAGAGLITSIGTATFSGDTISGNTAAGTGGGALFEGSVTLSNDSITGNSAGLAGGFAVESQTQGGLNTQISSTGDTISNNTAGNAGGGIFMQDGNPFDNLNITLTNDTISSNSAAEAGGFLYVNSGLATLSGDTISGNSCAGNGTGGGIDSFGTLAISNSTFSNNTAVRLGGAIANAGGTLTSTNDTYSGNSAGVAGGYLYTTGTVTETGDTINGGTTTAYGGGIFTNGGAVTLSNSTIYGNTAGSYGGGIAQFGGTLSLTSVTIASNTASLGGGILNLSSTAPTLDNTLVANNISTASYSADIYGTVTATYSLVGDTTGATVNGSNNQLNVPANLGSFGLNGGITETVALIPGPVGATSTGDPALAGTISQNGLTRPTPPDIGAYQAAPTVTSTAALLPVTSSTLTINGFDFDTVIANDIVTFTNLGVTGTVTAATPTTLTVTLTGFINQTGGTPLEASVTVDGTNLSGAAVQVATAQPVVTPSVAVIPNTATTLTIAGYGFDANYLNDSVTFTNAGVSGTVTAATANSLTVTLTGLNGITVSGTALNASVTVDGASSTTAQVATVAVAPTITSVVINQDISALYNAAGQPNPGAQRSMVNDIVYTFSEPVNVSGTDFTVTVAAGWTGTVPTTLIVNNVGPNEYAVTFSGAGVTGGSIANGAYDITINPALVTDAATSTAQLSVINGLSPGTPAMPQPGYTEQAFFRLFGDINGDEAVNNADNSRFKQALSTYNAAFDFNADATVNNADNVRFKLSLSIAFTGFTATI